MRSHAEPEGADLGTLLSETRRLCPSVRAAVLLGRDGLVVERFLAPGAADLDPELLAAEGVSATEQLAAFAEATTLGPPAEWTIQGAQSVVVLRRIPGSALLLLLLASASEWHGRLRFAARVTAGRLEPIVGEPEPPAGG
jgi:predicted regulator of Ras-like GTPase activity (Roadblock/LC7/MglB family)